MTAQSKLPVDPPPESQSEQQTYGFGRQSRGSRKGLGGDPPNAPVVRRRRRRAGETTAAQASDMESEGQGQK